MYDSIIIGAGPSGSSVANILAKNGFNVLILEKETFPRYHIGESLIPFTFNALDELNVIEDLHRTNYTKKYSVQFVQQNGIEHKPFYFFNRYDKDTIAQTWQVERSSFDLLLVNKALSYGAKISYNTLVTELIHKDNTVVGVKCIDINTQKTKTIYAKWIVDASGRSALASKHYNWQKKDSILTNKMAVWSYYKGCTRPEGIDSGATVIAFLQDKGWFWYIPLADNITSIGVVAESKYLTRGGVTGIQEIYKRELESNLWIKEKLKTATQVQECKSTTDYSKQSTNCVAPGIVLVGDANAFLDPVFSSGVLLALKSGVQVGKILVQGLQNNSLNVDLFSDYQKQISISIENMRKLVYAFYNVNISFKDIITEHPWVSDRLTDCLSGDLDKDYSDLWCVLDSFN